MATRNIMFDGTTIAVPEDATEEQIASILRARMGPPEPPAPPDSFLDNTLDVAGELANSFTRGITSGLDFLGPGTVNAGLRLAGSDMQLPTLTGGLEALPGGEGNFMEPGLARDVVQGGGEALSAVPGMVSAGPRNLAKNSDAALEFLGFGAGSNTTGALTDIAGDMTRAPEAAMAYRADAADFPLSPGDRFDSPTLKRIDAAIESTPIIGNPMHAMHRKRQQMMNDAAAQSIGLRPGTPLIDETIGNTADNLSATFDNLDQISDLDVDEQFVQDLVRVGNEAKSRLFTDPDINTTINKVFDKVDDSGMLSAPDYQDMSSELKKVIRAAWRGESPDANFADSMGGIVDALDRLAVNGMDPKALSELRRARSRWKALSQLEKSRALRESGDVSGPLLANYLRRTDKGGYLRGKNDSPLYETARLLKAFPGQPDSGTASRQLMNQIMHNPARAATALALAPVTSLASNVYMHSPAIMAGAARMAQQSPSAGAILNEMAQNPGALLATPGRAVGGWLED